jgi:hypothetical protein
MYLFRIEGKAKKDTLLLKSYSGVAKPTEMTIKKFQTSGVAMYCLSWKEQQLIDTKTKKEEITATYSQIWNPIGKIKLVDNEQKTTKITEQVFLDKLKTASETQIKTKNEGYTLTLLPNGDYTLKNKSVESKYVYNPKTLVYEIPPKVAPAPVATKPTKKRR